MYGLQTDLMLVDIGPQSHLHCMTLGLVVQELFGKN